MTSIIVTTKGDAVSSETYLWHWLLGMTSIIVTTKGDALVWKRYYHPTGILTSFLEILLHSN
jgi:hypothetical protein